MVTVDNYTQERECTYKGERYVVRDNGAVKRLPKEHSRKRPLDSKWTFGNTNKQEGYMSICGVPIHRIVATAFHGEPKDPQYVVDHINTNRQDNTPGNLRWVTRFENTFLNPITCKKLELLTKLTIDEILQNPRILDNYTLPKSIDWMRKVSPKESQNCYQNLMNWAKNSNIKPTTKRGAIGEWVYQTENVPLEEVTLKTNKALKVYPCCPTTNEKKSLENYQIKLKPGNIFLKTDYAEYVVIESIIFNKKLIVRSKSVDEDAVKPWYVSSVTLENGRFEHELVTSCFTEEGSKEYFDIMQDKPWESHHSIDYSC